MAARCRNVNAIPSSTESIEGELWSQGFARLGNVLSTHDCEALRALYSDEFRFRSTIEMERYRFGRGSYRYFCYPLPQPVEELRQRFYELLSPVANVWMEALGLDQRFPSALSPFLHICHEQAQNRPTPLLLRYRAGDFNCLHQDIYGPLVFPFQVIVSLSDPESEFRGGELLLVEQRPRAQSIGHAVRLEKGEAVAITTRYRPIQGRRSFYRANFRHGVSRVHSGERFALGLIFHDAA